MEAIKDISVNIDVVFLVRRYFNTQKISKDIAVNIEVSIRRPIDWIDSCRSCIIERENFKRRRDNDAYAAVLPRYDYTEYNSINFLKNNVFAIRPDLAKY